MPGDSQSSDFAGSDHVPNEIQESSPCEFYEPVQAHTNPRFNGCQYRVREVCSLSLSMRALDEFSVFVSRNEIREIPREWLVERGEKKKLINFYDNPPTVLWTMSLFIPRTVDTWQFHWIFFTWNLQFRPKREKEGERKFRIIEKQLFSIDYAIFTVKGLNNDTLGETRRGGKFLCPFKPVD